MMINIGANRLSGSELTNVEEGDKQPNAVDLRIDRVWSMLGDFILSKDSKQHRGKFEINPNSKGFFELPPGSYEVTFANKITIAHGEAGFVITRSTLNRNGVFLTSGLYDSGYSGAMAACLHVDGGTAYVEKGAPIGQMLMWKAESTHAYDGSYGLDKDGNPKVEETRYHV